METSNPFAPASPEPDIMNDPAFDTNPPGKEKEEPDTCRICRGEATGTEPLFYPCKCSGSIKFVHQDCLMEWLSHSQKKHCELCKTSFRFTKLYHPQMPSSVPLPVFLKQAGVHAFNTFLTWARWNLVIFIWLGWVPWCMRTVWRGLFWIGDGGWITAKEIEKQTASMNLERLAKTGTSPANWGLVHSMAASPNALVQSTGGMLSAMWRPFSRALNFTNPAAASLFRGLHWGVSSQSSSPDSTQTSVELPQNILSQRSPSLLSNFSFLNNLTRITTINNAAIDVLEGQLITLAVVVIFILVFLIREWVVQQQPAINAAHGPVDAAQVNAAPEDQEPAEEDRPVNPPVPVENGMEEVRQRRILPMPMLRARPNAPVQGQPNNLADQGDLVLPEPQTREIAREDSDPSILDRRPSSSSLRNGQPESSTRPSIPDRNVFTQVGEINRLLEERSVSPEAAKAFMDVLNRGDPDAVLRILRQEGWEDELGFIVTALRQQGSQLRSETSPGFEQDMPESQKNNNHHGEDPSQLLTHTNPGVVQGNSGEPTESLVALTNSPTSAPNSQIATDGSDMEFTSNEQVNNPFSLHSPNTGSLEQEDEPTATDEILNRENDHGDELREGDVVQGALGGTESSNASSERRGDEAGQPSQTFRETLQEWLWGEVPNIADQPEDDEDDGHVVDNIAEEPPFIPIAQGQPVIGEANAERDEENRDPEVLQAAAEAGIDPNDPEAIDDGEDLEGLMELIGMQGPLAGLIQNGIFSAVLISLSLLSGVWVPYVTGKATLVLLANPVALLIKLPLRWLTTMADIMVDTFIVVAGCAFYWVDRFVRFSATPTGWLLPFVRHIIENKAIPTLARRYTWDAADRLKQTVVDAGLHVSESDVPVFSIVAHESLITIKGLVSQTFLFAIRVIETTASFVSGNSALVETSSRVHSGLSNLVTTAFRIVSSFIFYLSDTALSCLQFHTLQISIDTPQRTQPLDYNLAQWSATDRILAILFGYLFFFILGILYIKIKNALKDPEDREKSDSGFVEVLNQAGGVTKVILIISIEMILFPLYCGMLLDVALLPLFDKATVSSRLAFTLQSPATSVFVHWFVGTCYMFHFALFVSMCRKIMRTGVLYFIRDPDDPSFHPVRDVLERNVYTQLRKIAFSAMVYGALVIICLGTVVWSISLAAHGVFPIQWSSHQPVLDFPIDLLAYNFLMPIAIKFFRPSKGLHTIYEWWFRKCARWLRLSHFLFNERQEDEEGYHIRSSTMHTTVNSTPSDSLKGEDVSQKRFIRSGRFVRAPASDQVRLPKGSRTFVDVDEKGDRLDGQPDSDRGLHGRNNTMFSDIYIPPNFRLRIATFIVLLWCFASSTGVGVTVIPLLFGRTIFDHLLPSPTRMNDIYAYAIGTYLLGGPLYLIVRYRRKLRSVLTLRPSQLSLPSSNAIMRLQPILGRGFRLAYFYLSFSVLLPTLFAMIFEVYLLIPLHTYTSRHTNPAPEHTVHFVQDWTLGVLALKLAARILLAHPNTRPSQALRALVSPGNRGSSWVDPDIRLATRAFILPASVLMLLALGIPVSVGQIMLLLVPQLRKTETTRTLVYRYAYPTVLGAVVLVLGFRLLAKAMSAWRAKVRDEVYLIGERLHNFGEKKPRGMGRVVVR